VCGRQDSSSAVLDFDAPDLAAFPRLAAVRGAREVMLSPGEVLYIPPLWLHSVQGGKQGNAAVNVFWRDLPREAYEPKDLYGNRDPVAANRAAAAAAEVRGGWWVALVLLEGNRLRRIGSTRNGPQFSIPKRVYSPSEPSRRWCRGVCVSVRTDEADVSVEGLEIGCRR